MAEHLPTPPASAPAALQPDLSLPQGLAYGLMGLPLAFVALPLYVVLPHHYASTLGAPPRPWGACCWAPACWTRWSTPAWAGSPIACCSTRPGPCGAPAPWQAPC